MAFLQVGITDNLVFSDKTTVNAKGTLELYMKTNNSADSLMAAFEGNTTLEAAESKMLHFPPGVKDFQGSPKTSETIAKELLDKRKTLLEYAYLLGTKDEANGAIGGLKMFEGVVDPAAVGQALLRLTNEDLLNKVFTNLLNKFVAYLQAKKAFSGSVTFRHKFARQSKDKHYITLPAFGAFVELMEVPKAQSKLVWTEWEIANGKNNPNPVASSKSKNTEVEKAALLFGGSSIPEAPKPSPTQPGLLG